MIALAAIEHLLVEYLANAIWQLPLLAGGVWLLIRAVRPGPLAQHRLWLAVLLLAVVLPLRGMGNASVDSVVVTEVPSAEETLLPVSLYPVENRPSLEPVARHTRHRREFPLWTESPRLTVTSEHWVAALYLASVLLGLLRVVRAWHRARHLVAHSCQAALTREKHTILENCVRRLRVRLPRLLESAEITSPVVVGAVAPVLLLPANFSTHSDDEVEAALYHELAHIQRRDYLVNLVCQVAAVPMAWHPVTYAVRRRIGRTREMVCDAMAAHLMHSEIRYAKCLLALAEAMAGGRRVRPSEVLGLFGNHILEERVMKLTESKAVVNLRTRSVRATLGATAMIATTAFAASFHIAPAMADSTRAVQQEPASTVPPAPSAPPSPPLLAQVPAVPAPPSPSEVPAPPSMPAPPAAPAPVADPTPPASPRSAPEPRPAPEPRHAAKPASSASDDRTLRMRGKTLRELTPVERQRVEKQLADSRRQIEEATAQLDSPEFKRQIEQAQKQAMDAATQLNSAEFKRQMREAEREIAEAKAQLNSPEFKRQMEQAQKEAMDAELKLNSPEFKKQMEDAQRQVAEATAQFESPEFKRQMEDARKQAAEATSVMSSQAFKQQMEDARKQMDQARKSLEEASRSLRKSSTPSAASPVE